ncbi:hypothetical protein OXPF_18690 [Oxobacter pfennigii]|uniref:Uncharacterized protein n=1 Tax=Oxobacter pfennigii TaxID=36849 RepID=A0A0P8W7Y3_9CLOT|nr:hypothetical protein OXPF_18690 [Oxobacter pfennigii]
MNNSIRKGFAGEYFSFNFSQRYFSADFWPCKKMNDYLSNEFEFKGDTLF